MINHIITRRYDGFFAIFRVWSVDLTNNLSSASQKLGPWNATAVQIWSGTALSFVPSILHSFKARRPGRAGGFNSVVRRYARATSSMSKLLGT